MLTDKSTENLGEWIDETLTEIRNLDLPQHVHNCFHCGLPIVYPVIARQQDIDDFQLMIESAERIMLKYGITLNLLAEIRAECLIALARRKALKNE